VLRLDAWRHFDQPLEFPLQDAVTVFVDVTLDVLDRATVTQRLASRSFRAYYVAIAASIDDPAGLYPSFLLPGGASNWAKYDVPEVNRLYAEQDSITNDAQRTAKAKELQLKTIELAWYPPVAERHVQHALQASVRQFPTVAGSAFSNRYRFEQVWLDQ
jgi:ABC-type transport system substrate-binding protein